jgi:hypothetical protein
MVLNQSRQRERRAAMYEFELALNNRRTVKEILSDTDDIIPNSFTADRKARWLSECEAKIITEIFLARTFSDIYFYTWPQSENRKVLVGQPYDALYDEWLRGKIEWANGEYEKYGATMVMFNQKMEEFTEWFCNYYQTWKWNEPYRQLMNNG